MPTKPPTIKRPWIPDKKQVPKPARSQSWSSVSNGDVYHSTRWRKLRARILERDPLCVECKKNKRLSESIVADHIVPINMGGDPWDEENLQGLCTMHHNAKSGRERHEKQLKP